MLKTKGTQVLNIDMSFPSLSMTAISQATDFVYNRLEKKRRSTMSSMVLHARTWVLRGEPEFYQSQKGDR